MTMIGGMSEIEEALAERIWNYSRQDEGSISAMGANIIAKRLVADGYRLMKPVKLREHVRPDNSLTPDEVAQITRVERRTVYRFFERGLKSTKVYGYRWIDKDDLREWLTGEGADIVNLDVG
jgi:excisionase family DNA binding protein